jgi:hypothetical protein
LLLPGPGDWRSRLIRLITGAGFFSLHSQIRHTFQPAFLSSFETSVSDYIVLYFSIPKVRVCFWFAVGDNGLEPVGTNKNFANMDLPWMADRLGSFTDLLSDLEVLEKKGETISLGKNAEEFIGTLF